MRSVPIGLKVLLVVVIAVPLGLSFGFWWFVVSLFERNWLAWIIFLALMFSVGRRVYKFWKQRKEAKQCSHLIANR